MPIHWNPDETLNYSKLTKEEIDAIYSFLLDVGSKHQRAMQSAAVGFDVDGAAEWAGQVVGYHVDVCQAIASWVAELEHVDGPQASFRRTGENPPGSMTKSQPTPRKDR